MKKQKINIPYLLFSILPSTPISQNNIDKIPSCLGSCWHSEVSFPLLVLEIILVTIFISVIFYLIWRFSRRENLIPISKFFLYTIVVSAGNVLINVILIKSLFKYVYDFVFLSSGNSYSYFNYWVINKINSGTFRMGEPEFMLAFLYFIITTIILYEFNYWTFKKIINLSKNQTIILSLLMGLLVNPYCIFIFLSVISNVFNLFSF